MQCGNRRYRREAEDFTSGVDKERRRNGQHGEKTKRRNNNFSRAAGGRGNRLADAGAGYNQQYPHTAAKRLETEFQRV